LALVFLQDATAMVAMYEERGDNAMYKYIPVLKSEEFGLFKAKMKLALEGDECPTDNKLEACLPGVHQRLQSVEGRMGSMQRGMGTIGGAGGGTEDKGFDCYWVGGCSKIDQRRKRRRDGITGVSKEVGGYGG
jgi:hypothetical protein